ncbi:serine/threonine-protein kinase STY13 [Amaranthus tricolor]|uniref:serine/threonine-protein kinase STY13 n=1 Tax=Amaranthus tricolor TaxID=29722 RepID=UPI00258D9EDA|nr:serine/threonine-protein kinase STY13 [Amaranthus tricolor]
MNSKSNESNENIPEIGKTVEESNATQKRSLSDANDVGKLSSKSMMFRADMVDLKNFDIHIHRHFSRVLSRDVKEEWEIDSAKLELKYNIANGTYGSVYKAIYDGREVAAKVLNWGEDGMATAAEIENLRNALRKEVVVWNKLDHPNVTKFIGASMGFSNFKIPSASLGGEVDNSPPPRTCCVVVEYLAGGTLKHYLIKHTRRKLPMKVVIELALDLSRGLSYLHSKKIVHRDVKTENMLLDTSRRLKIADFGVARVEAQNPCDMTGETGTLGYMAPEVLDGKPYNRKCDVYSFGICLWEIYCCDMPYANLSFADVSSSVVRLNLRPEIPGCCPAPLANIMRKCWDANPYRRPEMEEVVKQLETIDTSKGDMVSEDRVQSCFCFSFGRGP